MILFLLIFIVTFFFTIFSSRNFIVNESIFIYDWHIYLSIIISLYLAISSIRKTGYCHLSLKQQNKNPYLFSFICLTIMPFFSILAFEKFLFYPFHFLFKDNQKVIELTINKKVLGRYGKKCFLLKEYNLEFNNKICGISKAYDKLKVNDKIKMNAEYSIFGIKPIEYYLPK